MSNITVLKQSNPMPDDFPSMLRALADRVERGEITSFVGAWSSENYEFLFPSSLSDSLVLATLLQRVAVDKFRGE